MALYGRGEKKWSKRKHKGVTAADEEREKIGRKDGDRQSEVEAAATGTEAVGAA